VGDLTTCWSAIDKILTIMLTKIQSTFGNSLTYSWVEN